MYSVQQLPAQGSVVGKGKDLKLCILVKMPHRTNEIRCNQCQLIYYFFCYFVCFNFLVKLPSGAENKKQPTEFFLMSIPSY